MYQRSSSKLRMATRYQYGKAYDLRHQPVGSIMNGRILDLNGHMVGQAKNERVYDAHGNRIGSVISSHLYNAAGNRVGRISADGYTYDREEREVGRVSLPFYDRVLSGAAALLLLLKSD